MTTVRGADPARLRRRGYPLVFALVLTAGLAGSCPAAEEKALPSDLALVPRNGPAFVTLRVGDLADSKPGKEFLTQLRKEAGNVAAELEKEFGVPLTDIERLTILPPGVLVVRTAEPYDREKLLDALAPKARREKLKDRTIYRADNGVDVYLVDDRTFVKGRDQGLRWLWDRPAAREGQGVLGEALDAAAGKHHVVAGVNPAGLFMTFARSESNEGSADSAPAPKRSVPARVTPPELPPKDPSEEQEAAHAAEERQPREAGMEELFQRMPPEALPYKPLLQARVAVLTADLGEESKLQLRVTFPNKDIAKDGETALKTGLYVLRELLPRAVGEIRLEPDFARQMQPMVRKLEAALRGVVIANEGPVVTADARFQVDPAAFTSVALQMRHASERMQGSNNLKQIAIAFHAYHDAMGFMPPATIYSKDGKPLLSWRVAILPYIEEDNLYKQFKLDEPWDSPHNKRLLARMPKVYAPVRGHTREAYSTHYQVFTGALAPFQLKPDGSVPFGAHGPRLPATFLDGTSNTFLVVEAADAVPWTKPEDLAYDDTKPVPKLGAEFTGGFLAAFADGAVHFIRKDIDEQTLRYLIMPADGNPIDWQKIEGNRGGSSRARPPEAVPFGGDSRPEPPPVSPKRTNAVPPPPAGAGGKGEPPPAVPKTKSAVKPPPRER